MPPKRRNQPPPPEPESSSESEGGSDMMGGGQDLSAQLDPNFSKKFLAKLQPEVRERVAVVQALDKQYEAMAKAHDHAILELRRKYAELAAPIFEQRRKIVVGEVEASEELVNRGFPKEHEGQVSLTDAPANVDDDGAKGGLKNFWLNCLQHHIIIDEAITERDEEALAFVQDITYKLLDPPAIGFTLAFVFAENPFFSNTILSKTFYLSAMNDEFVLERAEGTNITWKDGKDLGVKTVTRKQTNKKKGAVRYVTTTEPCETFFDFFKNGLEQEHDEQNHAMAETIKDKIVPFAVEYYTGEAPDGQSDLEGDDDWDGSDEEEEEEEEEEPAPAPAVRGGGKGRGSAGAAPPAAPARGRGGKGAAPQPDCKQQ